MFYIILKSDDGSNRVFCFVLQESENLKDRMVKMEAELTSLRQELSTRAQPPVDPPAHFNQKSRGPPPDPVSNATGASDQTSAPPALTVVLTSPATMSPSQSAPPQKSPGHASTQQPPPYNISTHQKSPVASQKSPVASQKSPGRSSNLKSPGPNQRLSASKPAAAKGGELNGHGGGSQQATPSATAATLKIADDLSDHSTGDISPQPTNLSFSSQHLGSTGANSTSPTPSPPSHTEEVPPTD